MLNGYTINCANGGDSKCRPSHLYVAICVLSSLISIYNRDGLDVLGTHLDVLGIWNSEPVDFFCVDIYAFGKEFHSRNGA